MGDGVRYESIRNAARKTKKSRATIYRYLSSPTNTNWTYLEKEQTLYGPTPVFGSKDNGVTNYLFESFTACIEAGFATNKQSIRRKVQRNEPGWHYAHIEEIGYPKRTPYSLKPGEVAYSSLNNIFE